MGGKRLIRKAATGRSEARCRMRDRSHGRPVRAAAEQEPLAARLKRLTSPVMVCVAPGLYRPLDASKPIPDITVSAWVPDRSGFYRAVPVQDNFVRWDRRMADMLGFKGRNYATILRLGKAGFIELVKIAPFTQFINLTSFWNHIRRCAEDPEFWEHPANREAYRRAI
jgi:hypothetical protein